MKNEWLIPIIKQLEDSQFYGKLILNFCKGDVPKVKKEEDILKPKEGKGEQNVH